MVLCVTLHHLRQPSYDICARAVVEKRCTRYGLRTNSLMLLGLCLGWIFGILSFQDKDKDVVFQLSFGLVNGLQVGIFSNIVNSTLMTRHYPDLGSASDWSYTEVNLLQPIRSITQIWIVTRHQHGISALVSQTSKLITNQEFIAVAMKMAV
ncbi:unnamed protein product [Porites evermanni]|uniref:Uncharacterized protein n=1 Tax=Porites evermanni TaxID=104178 RepID=A0ABN8SZM1_9CNID|nr:unnamed protein product [Porites evermanni]